jgi:chemotaxis protein CheX
MNAAYTRPLVMAVQNVFETMIQIPVVHAIPFFKKDKRSTTDVMGMVTMSGAVSGFICLGLSKKLAFLLASKLLGGQITEASPDCIDAIGEITNMIAGNAKSEFPDEGVSISVPKVVFDSVNEPYSMICPVISLPFKADGEDFYIDMGIVFDRQKDRKV